MQCSSFLENYKSDRKRQKIIRYDQKHLQLNETFSYVVVFFLKDENVSKVFYASCGFVGDH